jgi:hypothetical protein
VLLERQDGNLSGDNAMGITYRDVQMLGDSIDSASAGFLRRRQMDRDEEERVRRALLEKRMQEDTAAYRTQMLDAQKQERSDTAGFRKSQADAAKSRYDEAKGHEERMEKQAQDRNSIESKKQATESIEKFHKWLQEGVKGGVIPAAQANQTLRQSLAVLPPEQKAMLAGTPWEKFDSDLFVDPKQKPNEMDYAEDPVTGERFAIRGNQTLKSGVNPQKAEQISDAQARAKLQREELEANEVKRKAEVAELEKKAAPLRNKIQSGNRYVGPEFMGIGDRQKELDAIEAKLKEAKSSTAEVAPVPQVPGGQPQAAQQPARQTGVMHGVARPQNEAEAARLPKGVKFLNPADGKIYIKK